jgi:hypothetical protein
MTISIRDAATWKTATPYVKDAGTWKALTNGYVKDAGSWKEFFTAEVVSISANFVGGTSISPTDCTVTYALRNNGNISRVFNGAITTIGTWLTPGTSAANYEVMATLSSGVSPTGGSGLGTWLSLASDQSWFLTNTLNGTFTRTCVLAVQIRRASDGVVMASASVTIEADVDV